MRFFKQLGMAAAARSASGSVNAKWMLPSIPTGFGSGFGVVGIGGYHTATEVGRYWTRYSVLKKVFESNLKGGVVHECSYHPLKRGIYVVRCFEREKFEIPKTEEDLLYKVMRPLITILSALELPLLHQLVGKVMKENFKRLNTKGAILHEYQFSWREGVKLTPILNLSGRAGFRFEANAFLLTFKLTPTYSQS